jgi:DNA-binding beta-propeller fold protein YncE
LTHVISADGDRDVVGVTSIDDCLFVLRKPSRQRIEVYDLKTFTLERHTLAVSELDDHPCNGLTACVVNKCLYINDYANATVQNIQLTVDKKISKWSVGRGPCGLSINTACNLLVACAKDMKIEEYTTIGSLVREIRPWNQKGLSLIPLHAIQLANGQLLVSCQYEKSNVCDVVELDARGRVLVSYTNQLKSTTQQNFSHPRHLAVDKNNKCILVADNLNNRIVILSRSSTCRAREFNVMSVDGGLQYPSCLHFNLSQGRLFVGEDSHRSRGQRRILVGLFDNVINIVTSSKMLESIDFSRSKSVLYSRWTK